jgi:hypothetical protein
MTYLSTDNIVDKAYRPFIALSLQTDLAMNRSTPTEITWDRADYVCDVYTFTLGQSGITINVDGWYHLTAEISLKLLNNSATTSVIAIFQNNTQVGNSLSFGYHTNKSNGTSTLTVEGTVQALANDVLDVRGWNYAGSGNLSTVASGCRMRIEQMLDSPYKSNYLWRVTNLKSGKGV